MHKNLRSHRAGFTLIELGVALVVLGILAAVAMPRYSSTKDKAYVAAMKADLRNAATFEEQYAAENGGNYFAGTATSESPLDGYTPSKEITVTFTAFISPTTSLRDWSASVHHAQSPQSCEIEAGVVTCTTENALTTSLVRF